MASVLIRFSWLLLWLASNGLLQQGNAEYDAKRRALYEYYHPLEISATIPIKEKSKLMEEWWEKTHGLLIEGGLSFDAIKKSVSEATIAFRDGVVELFELLELANQYIPPVPGDTHQNCNLGTKDCKIELYCHIDPLADRYTNCPLPGSTCGLALYRTIEGCFCLVTTRNKLVTVGFDRRRPLPGEISLAVAWLRCPDGYSVLMKQRTNVLLLGDHVGDLGMSDGLSYENRIAVGFLNNNTEMSFKSFLDAFDVVYLVRQF
ncbi:hypothetical protein BHM03_00006208 [Ensete ventricosum]|nr:hypothetical protein BHM03_00006208 [Ensete ventricosum]